MNTFVVGILCLFVTLSTAANLLYSESATAIQGQYIVILQNNASTNLRDIHLNAIAAKGRAGDEVLSRFDIGSFIGYSAHLSQATLNEVLMNDALVDYVEVDQTVSLAGTIVQRNPTWGLDRIDQTSLPLSGTYTYNDLAGANVNSYIIDTGILTTHTEFAGGRAVWGINYADTANQDCNGHGTHVAGTVGGTVYGVSKKTTLIAVKVLNCQGSGTNSGVINGVAWASNHYTNSKKNGVANMSLGGGASSALDQAVEAAIKAGLGFAVAAGNENANACNSSPARVSAAVTVGATSRTDARSSFSNWGTCLDIFAPGQDITSAWIGSNTATNTISGTSMASPHVAGAMAMYLSTLTTVNKDTKLITDYMKKVGTINKVTSPGTGSPNLLLYSPY